MLGDDNSVVAVVVLPALAGALGYLLVGPIGFFAGAALVLIAGAMVEDETDDRIAELEAQVAELEARVEAETDGDGDS